MQILTPPGPPAGLYVHVPYCKQACSYCDFYFTTGTRSRGRFAEALAREAQLRGALLATGTSIRTVYFGGGTPSQLQVMDIQRIYNSLAAVWDLSAVVETTLEANPDDLTPEYLAALARTPINRLSIGIQSFSAPELAWMNRAHTAQQATECVRLAQAAGFGNISIDLIFHTPFLSLAQWQHTLDQAIGLGVQHISAYGLTVEPRTALSHRTRKGQLPQPPEAAFAEQLYVMIDTLADAGFEHYETSNFALPGWRAQHNASYWHGAPYVGLGPSAHGFQGRQRYRNVPHHLRYADALASGQLPTDWTETLTPADVLNELLLTRLRLAEGLPFSLLRETAKREGLSVGFQEEEIRRQQREGLIGAGTEWIRLTRKGLLFADAVAARLFWLNV